MSVVLVVVTLSLAILSFVVWWIDRDMSMLALAVFFLAAGAEEILQSQRPGDLVDALIEVAKMAKIVGGSAYAVFEVRQRRANRKSEVH